MIDTAQIEEFLRCDTFECPYLGYRGARISVAACVARQRTASPTRKVRGRRVVFVVHSDIDEFCRSGKCSIGNSNRQKVEGT